MAQGLSNKKPQSIFQKSSFSRMDKLKADFLKQEKVGSNKKGGLTFPLVTLALTGTSIMIYYQWNKMTPR